MPQAAIFDIDGTLVDSVDLHVSGRNHRREVCYGSLVLNNPTISTVASCSRWWNGVVRGRRWSDVCVPSNAFLVAARAIPLRTASSLKRLANDDPCIGDLELADC
jgi:hypothetical protein